MDGLEHDLVVIGSGFGGALAAEPAVRAGKRVLMIERGDWVRRGPDNWLGSGSGELTTYYRRDSPYQVVAGGYGRELGSYACVGGGSVFFGCVALRLRERDFESAPEIDAGSGAEWPYGYDDLEPFYTRAEGILGVAGVAGEDPIEPRRSAPYGQAPGDLAAISRRLAGAARELGLQPFRLPLAINYGSLPGRNRCVGCGTCDSFACAVQAKNDVATAVIPELIARGMRLATNTTAVRLEHDGRRVAGVRCTTPSGGATFRGKVIVLAAGALASPHLLLASGLQELSPAGPTVGRYLMRHCNGVIMGAFRSPPAPDGEFHKQLGFHDYYFGRSDVSEPPGKLGCIQQLATVPASVVKHHLPYGSGYLLSPFVRRTTGLLVIAEDRPQPSNRVALAHGTTKNGMPRASIVHRYDARDLAARKALGDAARRLLRRTGAVLRFAHAIKTFSHAVGTVRMGRDPKGSALDAWSAFRGLDNLYVTDGSALPRSGGVNPSLTIAANALRAGQQIVERL